MNPVETSISESVVAHETAHQWWGDLIVWRGYRDQWIFEALANYSSLMILEAENPQQFRAVMERYRQDLLQKNKEGVQLLDAGPVTLGSRLSSSHFPDGYDAISYGRGTWLFHMLRNMMRDGSAKTMPSRAVTDEPFVRTLRKVRDRYEGKAMTTRDLLRVFEEDLPPSMSYEGKKSLDWFYQNWVNGSALPKLELQGTKFVDKGHTTAVSGTLLQKSAPKELVTLVPVYAMVAGKPVLVGQVFADGPETPFHLTAPAGARKLVLDPNQTVLSRAH
jgi:aminopeptidase N